MKKILMYSLALALLTGSMAYAQESSSNRGVALVKSAIQKAKDSGDKGDLTTMCQQFSQNNAIKNYAKSAQTQLLKACKKEWDKNPEYLDENAPSGQQYSANIKAIGYKPSGQAKVDASVKEAITALPSEKELKCKVVGAFGRTLKALPKSTRHKLCKECGEYFIQNGDKQALAACCDGYSSSAEMQSKCGYSAVVDGLLNGPTEACICARDPKWRSKYSTIWSGGKGFCGELQYNIVDTGSKSNSK